MGGFCSRDSTAVAPAPDAVAFSPPPKDVPLPAPGAAVAPLVPNAQPTNQDKPPADAAGEPSKTASKDAEELSGTRFSKPRAIYEALRPPADRTPCPVRLVRASWLRERAERLRQCATPEERTALALPRRQEMPEEAFIGADELERLQPEEFMRRTATQLGCSRGSANVWGGCGPSPEACVWFIFTVRRSTP